MVTAKPQPFEERENETKRRKRDKKRDDYDGRRVCCKKEVRWGKESLNETS
jgi:hypothetical protein